MENLKKAWPSILERIEDILNDHVLFETFFEHMKLHTFENEQLAVVVEMKLQKHVLETQKEVIINALNDLGFVCKDVKVILDEDLPKVEVPFDTRLNETMTFVRFVVGSENRLAHAASLAITQTSTSYNPLVIYGGVGLGKTHLLHAIGNQMIFDDPTKKVLYLSADEFMDDYISSIKNNRIDFFDKKYAKIDVLLVDHLHSIAHKERSQEVLLRIFEIMTKNKKQVVVACTDYPTNTTGLDSRFASFLTSGLVIKLEDLQPETTKAILKQTLKEREMSDEVLDEKTLNFIAQNCHSVRELQGVVNKMIFFMILENKEHLSLEEAEFLFTK